MKYGVHLISLRYKKGFGFKENQRVLFLVKDNMTREAFVKFMKSRHEELDLRTSRSELNFDDLVTLKNDIVMVESQKDIYITDGELV